MMQTEERICLYHQENRGLASTRNRGLDLSSGAYIYFLDADDMLKPGALRKIMDKLQSTGSELVYFPGQAVDKEDRKSTRLNSSHLAISYAVFCIKQKKKEYKI